MPEPGSPRGPEPRALVLSSFPLLVGSRRRLHPHREELPGPSFQPRRGCGAREEQRRGVLPSRIAKGVAIFCKEPPATTFCLCF